FSSDASPPASSTRTTSWTVLRCRWCSASAQSKTAHGCCSTSTKCCVRSQLCTLCCESGLTYPFPTSLPIHSLLLLSTATTCSWCESLARRLSGNRACTTWCG